MTWLNYDEINIIVLTIFNILNINCQIAHLILILEWNWVCSRFFTLTASTELSLKKAWTIIFLFPKDAEHLISALSLWFHNSSITPTIQTYISFSTTTAGTFRRNTVIIRQISQHKLAGSFNFIFLILNNTPGVLIGSGLQQAPPPVWWNSSSSSTSLYAAPFLSFVCVFSPVITTGFYFHILSL